MVIYRIDIKKSKKALSGFTLLELIMCMAIMVIMAGMLVSLKSPFQHRQQLEHSAIKLMSDLRLAHYYSFMTRGGYKFYGIRFYSNLGEDLDRDGYKLVYYNSTDPINQTAPVNLNAFTVTKGSVAADNPELVENTYFSAGITYNTSSGDFGPAGNPQARPVEIVFNPQGAATTDGVLTNLVNDASGDGTVGIVIKKFNYNKTIEIEPLTGNIKLK